MKNLIFLAFLVVCTMSSCVKSYTCTFNDGTGNDTADCTGKCDSFVEEYEADGYTCVEN